ncbi:MAG: UDP-N-acetylmuramoyl-tripeptide--D-alanyl-D-alanine ligase [Bacteroidota bacterium]|jgi:UDP-N-acetylmuramoyl-tripeptide--D-alanyl-D-alanine ligase
MTTTAQLYSLFLKHPHIITDTRKLTKGGIFFALKGGNFNGNQFAFQALNEGAAYAVIDEDIQINDDRLLMVDDVLKALQDLATYHRIQTKIPVLAITGSNGKTTTKELIAAVLSKKYNVNYTQGNLNNHIGVPLTLLSITNENNFAVVEMGANHQKEIELLASIAQPDFGLITNIGKAHLEGFGGIEGVKKGKGELYQNLKTNQKVIFIQKNSEALCDLLSDYNRFVSYGTTNEFDVCGNAISGNEFLKVAIKKPLDVIIQTNLTGNYNLDNVLVAVAVGNHFGVSVNDIKEAIENYQPSNQRSQIIRKEDATIVLDAYNANPSSMQVALENFNKSFEGYKIIALGEMLELGIESEQEHQRIGQLIKEINPQQIILVGSNFKNVATSLNANYFENSVQATEWLKANLPESFTILIKGSRGSKMEKLLEAIG